MKTLESILIVRPKNEAVEYSAKAEVENNKDLSHADAAKLVKRIIEDNERRNS